MDHLMKKALLLVMISLLLLSTACQKENILNKEENNHNTEEEKAETTANNRFVTDPYWDAWNPSDLQPIARFYLDINQDKIPELFLSNQIGSSGSTYSIYKIQKDGYWLISKLNALSIKLLPGIHSGYNDLLCTWHYATKKDQLSMNIEYYFMEYNGEQYSRKNGKSYSSIEEAKTDGLECNVLPTEYRIDYYQRNDDKIWDTLQWSPEDDQMYRDFLQLEEVKVVNRNISDPYKKTWDELGGAKGAAPYNMSRFYLDINQDSVPEIFLSRSWGTGGVCYEIYQIQKEGYWYISTIGMAQGVKVLPEMHHNFCDLIVSLRGGDLEHNYNIMEYNGEEFKSVTGASFKTPKERYDADIYKRAISSDYEIEYIYKIAEDLRQDVPWSPKDDDRYRNMIK